MSELIKKRLVKGNVVKIFLSNNFRFEGKIVDSDDEFIEINDFTSGKKKLIKKNMIVEAEIRDNDIQKDIQKTG